MEFQDGMKLFNDTYLAIFDKCLAVVKVNDKGEIVRVTTFGDKEGGVNAGICNTDDCN